MISIQNLSFQYQKGFFNLFDINLNIKKNEKINFISSNLESIILFRILSGLERKFNGKALIEGFEPNHKNFKKNISLSYIQTNPVLFKNKTTFKNLEYFSKINKIKEKNKIIENLLKKNNLFYLLHIKINKLSIYEQYLVCFLRAKLKNAKILLVDDIFDNLNNEERKNIFEFLKNNFQNTTVLIASKQEQAHEFFSRKIYFNFGSIEKDIKWKQQI